MFESRVLLTANQTTISMVYWNARGGFGSLF
jgi:hypothetical protein